jgi:hypothetical protein
MFVLGLGAALATLIVDQAGAQERLPAEVRQVLEQFAGTWNTSATITRLRPRTTVRETHGHGTCSATLGGRFYEFRTVAEPGGDSELQVMTYDPEAHVYRQWVFSSDGYAHAAEGTWNAETNTLRWIGTVDGTTFTIDDHFVEPGHLEWTLERFSADGTPVQRIQGTLTRVAE